MTTASSPADQICAIVLSGGEGRRFQRQDKGLIVWDNATLIEHVIHRLAGQVDRILISCNRNIGRYRNLGFSLFTDNHNGAFLGPLAGVQSARKAIAHPWCLICPNDVPRLPRDMATRLLSACLSNHAEVAYPVCGERFHYLPALVKTELLTTIDDYLAEGGRSLKHWYQRFNVTTVDFSSESSAFANINSPVELAGLD